MMKKFKIATLGCRTNQYESLAYQNQLKAAGYVEAMDGEEADLCIVNTCTVTQSADSHSRNQIRKLKKQYPKAKIAVTGCMVEKGKGELLKIKEADWVISNQSKDTLLNQIYPEQEFVEFALHQVDSQTRAFIKIQDGCNSFCSYCIIPYVRGRSKSKTVASVVQEVENVVKSGTKEIVLTGINIGDFDGADLENPQRLPALIKELEKVVGLEQIRISSIDPDEVDDALIEAIKSSTKVCPSMHVVLQSGSNWVLKRMNRKYTRQIFFETVDKLKAFNPEFTITTDIIVGFPGEREEDFQDTLKVMQEVKFAKVHMFPYSKRERTKAASFTDHLPPEVINERKNKILRMSEQYAFELRQNYVGKVYTVLTEESSGGISHGYTPHFLKVMIPSQKLLANQMVKVKIIDNQPEGLIGEICL